MANWLNKLSFGLIGGKSASSSGGLIEVPIQSGTFLDYAIGYGSGAYDSDYLTSHQAMRFYRKSSAVATAVDIIAQEVESIPPVQKLEDGTFTDSGPVLDLLRSPNDFNENYGLFIGQLSRNYSLDRNGFVFMTGTQTRPPLEMFSVKPQNATVQENQSDGYPQTFDIYTSIGSGHYTRQINRGFGARYYDGSLKELWQFRGYTSRDDNLKGDSPLLAICLEIWQNIKGRIHNVKLLENGGRPSLIVSFKGEEGFDQETHDYRKQALKEQLAGAENAGKIIPISAKDIDITELGKTNKDMDYSTLDEISSRAIYNRYRIPMPIVTPDRATFNNMQTAVEHLYDFAVIPNINRLFSELTMMLMPRFGLDPTKTQITYNPEEIPALKSRRLNELKLRKEINIETGNELREELPNRDPIDGMDVIYQPATLVPVGTDMFEDEGQDNNAG